MISDYLSKKLRFLSFFLVILVVFIHNYFGNIPPTNTFSYIFQTTLSKGVCYVANPLFFIISGFLFFRKREVPSIKNYSEMLTKRLRTLAIPYLLTSLLVIIIYGLLGITKFTSITDVLKVWLVEPIPFQLWFLRYLMLLSIISPIIYYLIKKTKYIYIVVILLVWFFLYYKIDWALISLAFFSLGGFVSINGIQIPYYNKNHFLLSISIIGWVFLSYIACIVYEDDLIVQCLVRNIAIACGLVAVWLLYDILYKYINKWLDSDILSYSFFIYLFHLPLILFVRKALLIVVPGSHSFVGNNIIYIITPMVTIFFCIILGKLMKRFIPPVYNIFTGSR
ncbi:MAG: acyltransferase family protein [Dysgonomonas sp.]